ncbi:MAG: hypothetical protein HY678_02500 [Chloroflexi bacterium]|nr:hypothetical protein [Chloroflexota bacterium]
MFRRLGRGDATALSQIYVEVEENPNCDYLPQQAFQALEPPREAAALLLDDGPRPGPHVVVGWSSRGGGSPTAVTYAKVTDSGAGASLLVSGGDYGIRIRPAGSDSPWRIHDPEQWGEPYLLLDPAIRIETLEES